jgi:hypothetical protein
MKTVIERMKAIALLSASLISLGTAAPAVSPSENANLVRSIEADVLAGLRSQDNSSESFGTGGVSGGTHMLLGAALTVGGLWLMMSLGQDSEDNFANRMIVIGAPVAAVGGVAEMVYGVVKMIRTRNEFQ